MLPCLCIALSCVFDLKYLKYGFKGSQLRISTAQRPSTTPFCGDVRPVSYFCWVWRRGSEANGRAAPKQSRGPCGAVLVELYLELYLWRCIVELYLWSCIVELYLWTCIYGAVPRLVELFWLNKTREAVFVELYLYL